MMTELEKYYNKFNEEKRLGSRHGQVEFTTSMKYIHEYLPKDKSAKILDVQEPAVTVSPLRKKVTMLPLLNWLNIILAF